MASSVSDGRRDDRVVAGEGRCPGRKGDPEEKRQNLVAAVLVRSEESVLYQQGIIRESALTGSGIPHVVRRDADDDLQSFRRDELDAFASAVQSGCGAELLLPRAVVPELLLEPGRHCDEGGDPVRL